MTSKASLALAGILVLQFSAALVGCVSSSESPDLSGSYSAQEFTSDPFTRRDSMQFSEDRFIHYRRHYDPRGVLVYVKTHWGFYEAQNSSLRFRDIGFDSLYNANGIDLAKDRREPRFPDDKASKRHAFVQKAAGFLYQEDAGDAKVWVEYLKR